jgi:hypothetical protein
MQTFRLSFYRSANISEFRDSQNPAVNQDFKQELNHFLPKLLESHNSYTLTLLHYN